MIQFHHVYKTYLGPVHALKDISLEVARGEFIFVIGPSGSGKTTLFKMLSAADKPTSGRIKVAGFALEELDFREVAYFRRKIGVVFQDFKLLKDFTIFENVELPLKILNVRPQIIKRRVSEILDIVGLKERLDYYPEQLSGGEKQRVAIARALIHHPEVLIADEPTGNLDPELSSEIIELFERINAQGTTLIVATHDHELVQRKNKRTLVLKEGALCNE